MSYHEFTTCNEMDDGTEIEIVVGFEHEPADPDVGFFHDAIEIESITTMDGKPVDVSPDDEASIADEAWNHFNNMRDREEGRREAEMEIAWQIRKETQE